MVSFVPVDPAPPDEDCETSEWELRLENASEVVGKADRVNTMMRTTYETHFMAAFPPLLCLGPLPKDFFPPGACCATAKSAPSGG
jgi:hypothetical protein